mgnify:CR=1 FL=1
MIRALSLSFLSFPSDLLFLFFTSLLFLSIGGAPSSSPALLFIIFQLYCYYSFSFPFFQPLSRLNLLFVYV